MTFFSVDSEQVALTVPIVQATSERLRSEVVGMSALLSNLSSAWQGQAASSFQELLERWKLTAQGVELQLAEIGNSLSLAANQYREIELANQRLFQA